MVDEERTTPAESETTEDDAGTKVGEEEQGLSTEDIDESVAAMMAAKGWMPPERVEETVKARLSSEREQRRAEEERKALEAQNEFKQLYETEKEARTKLEEERKTEAEARRQDRIRFELRDALRDEGINADYLPLALKVADTSTVEIVDGKVEHIPAVVEAVKNASPPWFGSEEKPAGSKPSPQSSGPTATQTDKEIREASRAHIGAAL